MKIKGGEAPSQTHDSNTTCLNIPNDIYKPTTTSIRYPPPDIDQFHHLYNELCHGRVGRVMVWTQPTNWQGTYRSTLPATPASMWAWQHVLKPQTTPIMCPPVPTNLAIDLVQNHIEGRRRGQNKMGEHLLGYYPPAPLQLELRDWKVKPAIWRVWPTLPTGPHQY